MSSRTKIEWCARPGTQPKSWNPTTGCSAVHEGCRNCYATVQTRIHAGHPNPKISEPYTGLLNPSGHFNGVVKCHEDRLGDPFQWKTPCTVFVNSMSDLFHPEVPDEFIYRVLATISVCPRHTFIVLTKRCGRMRSFMCDPGGIAYNVENMNAAIRQGHSGLENLWLGFSASDQPTFDAGIGDLLATPAAVRIVSAEPLLGLIDMQWALEVHGIDWVLVGGESGRDARPNHLEWTADIIRQCQDSEVACFHKQAGSNAFYKGERAALMDKKGGEPAEWPEELRVRQWPKS